MTADDSYESSRDKPMFHANQFWNDDNNKATPIEIPVFINFRELLWYWREYYLRRGRDRLSLEFSSQIPFKYWKRVSGKQL